MQVDNKLTRTEQKGQSLKKNVAFFLKNNFELKTFVSEITDIPLQLHRK